MGIGDMRDRVRAHPSVHRAARVVGLGVATAQGRLRRPPSPGERLQLVAHVPFYVPDKVGGAEQSLRSLLGRLHRRGHRCLVLDDSGEDREVDGVPVLSTADVRRVRLAYATADVILTQHRPAARRAIRLARAARRPVVYFVREPGMIPEVGQPDLVVFNAEHVREREESLVADAMVLPPPVDPGRYRTEPGTAATLVNLNEDKGARLLFALAVAEPDVEFLGVRGTWGKQLLPDRPLANLEIIDPIDDVRTIYGRTRVLLMPSRIEAFGRVALEAAASGIPTIAHPTPGLVENLGTAGTFVHRDDVAGWVRALRSLSLPEVYAERSALASARSRELDPEARLEELEDRLVALAHGTRA